MSNNLPTRWPADENHDWVLDDSGHWAIVPTGENAPKAKDGTKPRCWHTWVLYQGFREDYYYCKECDAKKDIEK